MILARLTARHRWIMRIVREIPEKAGAGGAEALRTPHGRELQAVQVVPAAVVRRRTSAPLIVVFR